LNRLFIENSNFVLHKILNNEQNINIVKDLIQSILNLKIKKIIIRKYLGKKVKNLRDEEKYDIINVRIIDEKDIQYNVGIQIIDGLFMQEKLLAYAATIHVNQIEYEEYNDIVDTITINIINFNGFNKANYHNVLTFMQRDEDDRLQLQDEIKIHVIELPKFKKEKAETKEEEWLQFFKGTNIKDIDEIKQKNEAIKMLDKELHEYWRKEKI